MSNSTSTARSFFGPLHEAFSYAKDDKSGLDSAFRLPILNTLGLANKKFRAQLQVYALSSPKAYTTRRLQIFDQIVSKMVKEMHDMLWNLLSIGTDIDGQTKIIDFGTDVTLGPSLPDTEIAQISNAFAQQIYTMMTKVYDELIPESISAQSNSKLRHSTLPTSINTIAEVAGDL